MAADEFYNVKSWTDLSDQELKKGLEMFAGNDVQQTIDVDFCRQTFRVLKMNAIGPVDSRMFMQNRAMRKYLADRGLTAVLKPGGRQYTPKHSKVLIEAIAAGIEPLAFRRKVKRVMRFNLVVHDPDALFNIID